MLLIRDAQMRELEAHALKGFVQRVYGYLLSLKPDKRDVQVVETEILATVRRCRLEYGLRKESEIAAILRIEHLHLTTHPELPREALSILCRWGVDPQKKIAAFETWATSVERATERKRA